VKASIRADFDRVRAEALPQSPMKRDCAFAIESSIRTIGWRLRIATSENHTKLPATRTARKELRDDLDWDLNEVIRAVIGSSTRFKTRSLRNH
jgi:hypothetical protein